MSPISAFDEGTADERDLRCPRPSSDPSAVDTPSVSTSMTEMPASRPCPATALQREAGVAELFHETRWSLVSPRRRSRRSGAFPDGAQRDASSVRCGHGPVRRCSAAVRLRGNGIDAPAKNGSVISRTITPRSIVLAPSGRGQGIGPVTIWALLENALALAGLMGWRWGAGQDRDTCSVTRQRHPRCRIVGM